MRERILGELHARPFPLLKAPLRAIHYSFMVETSDRERLFRDLVDLFKRHGAEAPTPGQRYHRVPIDSGMLRWELHAEFTTFTWSIEAEIGDTPFSMPPAAGPFGYGFHPPGPLLTAMHLVFAADPGEEKRNAVLASFDEPSLCVSEIAEGRALLATDFRDDDYGFVRYLVLDRKISDAAAGAAILRLHEIETYRTFALLGLPEVQAVAPSLGRMETALGEITDAIRDSDSLASNQELLGRLTGLGGELEADAARIGYRLGATQAYDEILQIRLKALGEAAVSGYSTLATFMARRMNPAMRTCQAIDRRQKALAEKLARATDLLRARVDIELEQQNSELLSSMNRRAHLQLRLQQTVEGLSIGAVSYYLLGIVGYAAKALKAGGMLPVAPEIVIGIFVPIVLGLVFWVTRRIRRKHEEVGGH
ncbi:MAG: DUF3422 domain-containing protein [Hyphomicrobiales bacterium]|nr:DUF3422 domain-containing protein [Hyphomicrobiales bacterium]